MSRSLEDARRAALQSAPEPTRQPMRDDQPEDTFTVTRSQLLRWGVIPPDEEPDPEPVEGPLLQLDRAEEDAAYEAAMVARAERYEQQLVHQQSRQHIPVHVQNAPQPQQDQIVGALIQQNQQLVSQVMALTAQMNEVMSSLRHGGSPVPAPRPPRRASQLSPDQQWREAESDGGLLG